MLPAPAGRSSMYVFALLAVIARISTVGLVPAIAPPGAHDVDTRRQQPTYRASTDLILVDTQVVARDGTPIQGLKADQFEVFVDGRRRPVLAAEFVRAAEPPGASERPAALPAAASARPGRVIVIAVDGGSFPASARASAREAATRVADRVAAEDYLGLMAFPGSLVIPPTRERAPLREAIGRISGDRQDIVASRYTISAAEASLLKSKDSATKDIVDRECRRDAFNPSCRQEVIQEGGRIADALEQQAMLSLNGLHRVLYAMSSLPGRKTLILISAGLPMRPGGQPNLDAETTTIAQRAAAANVNLYVFYINVHFLRSFSPEYGRINHSLFDDITMFGYGLEKFADSGGGGFFRIEVDSDPFVDRALRETSALYVLGVPVLPEDRDGKEHFIRVAVKQQGATVRYRRVVSIPPAGGSERRATPSPQQQSVPKAPVQAMHEGRGRAAPPAAEAAATRPAESPAAARARPAAGEEALQPLLARVVEYVAEYRKKYSAVVAEEDYWQSTPDERVHLRSDLLLIKSPEAEGWVSFRDVFDVNGVPVRDREERLKNLFLDPSPAARARLAQIKEESARYNIGPVRRNVNVPLFPLVFVDPVNVPRFHFDLGGRRASAGVRARVLEYEEQGRPTVVRNGLDDRDIPASGWFLVSEANGAVVQTATFYEDWTGACEILVQYARDVKLDIWVPARMEETYKAKDGTLLARGTATYSNLRCFQVTTDETIRIPK